MIDFMLEKKAFIEAINMLEDVIKINSQVSLNDYFRRYEENKDTYAFRYVEYHQGEHPTTILCYVPNGIVDDQRKVAFTAISTAAIPVYTPIMVHQGENGLVGYPSDYLEVYRDHVLSLNRD